MNWGMPIIRLPIERKISQRLDFALTFIALILLIFEWILINSKYRTIP